MAPGRNSVSCRWPTVLTLLGLLLLAGCSGRPAIRDSGPAHSMDTAHMAEPTPQPVTPSRYGNPASYVVFGRRYHVLPDADGYRKEGIASWYGEKFHGRRTSSGEPYDMYQFTAAHKTLPLPTYARVTNLRNGQSVVVRINDRGPFHDNRLIDLSYAAASRLGIVETGTGEVVVEALSGEEEISPVPEPPRRAAEVPRVQTTAAAPVPQVGRPEPLATEPAPLPTAGRGLYLQLGAFASRENAEQLRARLLLERESPLPVLIQRTAGAESAVYRVRLGPLASREEADRLAAQFTGEGFDSTHVMVD